VKLKNYKDNGAAATVLYGFPIYLILRRKNNNSLSNILIFALVPAAVIAVAMQKLMVFFFCFLSLGVTLKQSRSYISVAITCKTILCRQQTLNMPESSSKNILSTLLLVDAGRRGIIE